MNWEVRALEPSDLDAVIHLWLTTEGLGNGPGDSIPALTAFLSRNPGLSLVATDSATIVAAMLCGHDGRRGYIYRLVVANTHRRRGIATEMVRRCLPRLRTEGIERCQVFWLVGNEGSASFWRGIGGAVREELRLLSIELR